MSTKSVTLSPNVQTGQCLEKWLCSRELSQHWPDRDSIFCISVKLLLKKERKKKRKRKENSFSTLFSPTADISQEKQPPTLLSLPLLPWAQEQPKGSSPLTWNKGPEGLTLESKGNGQPRHHRPESNLTFSLNMRKLRNREGSDLPKLMGASQLLWHSEARVHLCLGVEISTKY